MLPNGKGGKGNPRPKGKGGNAKGKPAGPKGKGKGAQNQNQPRQPAVAASLKPILQSYRSFDKSTFEDFLSKNYPDVVIAPGDNPSRHPLLALDREYGYHTIYHWLKRNRGTGHVTEIGPRLGKMAPGWHGCAPVFGVGDQQRWLQITQGEHVNMEEKSSIGDEAWSYKGNAVLRPPNNAPSYCQHVAEECTCRFDTSTYVSVHSLYYIHPDTLVEMFHSPRRGKPQQMLAFVHRFGSPGEARGQVRNPSGDVEAKWARSTEGEKTMVEFQVSGESHAYKHSAMDWLHGTDVYEDMYGNKIGWTTVVVTPLSTMYLIQPVSRKVQPSRSLDVCDAYLTEIRTALFDVGNDAMSDLGSLCDITSADMYHDYFALSTCDAQRILIPREIYSNARIWAAGKERTKDGFQALIRKVKRDVVESKYKETMDGSAIHTMACLAYKVDMVKDAQRARQVFGSDMGAIDDANVAINWTRTPSWIARWTYGLINLSKEDLESWRRVARSGFRRIAGPTKLATLSTGSTYLIGGGALAWGVWRFQLTSSVAWQRLADSAIVGAKRLFGGAWWLLTGSSWGNTTSSWDNGQVQQELATVRADIADLGHAVGNLLSLSTAAGMAGMKSGLATGNLLGVGGLLGACVVSPVSEELVKAKASKYLGVRPIVGGFMFGVAEMAYKKAFFGGTHWHVPAVLMHGLAASLPLGQGMMLHSLFNAAALKTQQDVVSMRALKAEECDPIVDVCCHEHRADGHLVDPSLLRRSVESADVRVSELEFSCVQRNVGRLVGFGLSLWRPILYRSCTCNEAQAAVARLCRPVNWDTPDLQLYRERAWAETLWLISVIGSEQHLDRIAKAKPAMLEPKGRWAMDLSAVPDSVIALAHGSMVVLPQYALPASSTEMWLTRYPAHERVMLRRAREHIKECGLVRKDALVEAFIKREWKPVHIDKILDVSQKMGDPRVIQGRSANFKVAMGPWMWSFGKQLSSAWHPSGDSIISVASGVSAEMVGAWLCATMDELPNPVIIDSDVPRWDAQVCPAAKTQLCATYDALGAPSNVLKIRSTVHLGGRFRKGTSYTTTGQVQSGDGDTSAGNCQIHGCVDLGFLISCILRDHEANIPPGWIVEEQIEILRQKLRTQTSMKTIVLGDDGVKVFSGEFWEACGRLYPLWWEDHGFLGTKFSTRTIFSVEFCSSRFWPIDIGHLETYCLGPKIGRVLAKTFYVKDEIPEREHYAWLRAVCKSIQYDVSFVPILRAVVARLLELTEGTQDRILGSWPTEVSRFEQIHAATGHDVCDRTWDMMEELYGMSKEAIIEVEGHVANMPSTGWLLDHPVLNDIALIDNG